MSKDNETTLAGFHAINTRLSKAPETIRQICFDRSRRDKRLQSLLDKSAQKKISGVPVESDYLDELSGGVKHQGVVALVDPLDLALSIDEVFDQCQGMPFFLILDGVTDPHNLGACLRTADAAGVDAVIAPKNNSATMNATVRRVACGAAETVPYITVTNLARSMRELQDRGVWLIGTSDQATGSIYDTDLKRAHAWVMGAEGKGMRRLTMDTCDELLQIPMRGTVESLNVSVATAVCLYETLRQRS